MPIRDGSDSTTQERPRLRWPEDTPDDQTVRVLRAVSDPVRLRILWLLAHSEEFGVEDEPCCEEGVVCVCRIRAFFDISAPNLSHHLKVLREAGLVDTRRIGIWTHYHLRPQGLAAALRVVGSIAGDGDVPSARAASAGGRTKADDGLEGDDDTSGGR